MLTLAFVSNLTLATVTHYYIGRRVENSNSYKIDMNNNTVCKRTKSRGRLIQTPTKELNGPLFSKTNMHDERKTDADENRR